MPMKERKRKENEKENEASVTCLKLVGSCVAESRLQLEDLIQADTSGQRRAENGSIWASQSRSNRTERTCRCGKTAASLFDSQGKPEYGTVSLGVKGKVSVR